MTQVVMRGAAKAAMQCLHWLESALYVMAGRWNWLADS